MSFASEIKGLIDEGYSFDDILETFLEVSPELKDEVAGLQKEGYSSEDMVSTLLETVEPSEEAPQEQAPQNALAQIARGLAQGGLDIGNFGSLGQALIQSPLTLALSPEQREIAATPGMQARAEMEKEPGLTESQKVALYGDEEDLIGLPILPGQRKKLREEAAKIPEGGHTQEIIRRLTRTLPLLAGGPMSAALGGASEITGLGGREVAKKLGAGEIGQTAADIITGFYGASKFQKAFAPKIVKEAQKIVPKIATKLKKPAERAVTKAELIANPNKIQKEINKLGSDSIKKYEDKVGTLAEDTFTKPEFNAREIEDSLVKETKEAAIRSISPKVAHSEAAWNMVAEGVNKELKQARDQYRGLYRASEQQARKMEYLFTETATEAKKLQKQLKKITTKGKGQSEIERALGSTITDLTIKPMSQKKFAKALTKLMSANKDSKIIDFTEVQKLLEGKKLTTVDKAMALKRNLSDVINYEDLSPSVKDLLRPLVKTLKGEILEALDPRPLVKTAYQKAESKFASTAKTFNKDAITFLRAKDAPETAASKFLVGSNVKYLKDALKGSPDAWEAVEGQILKEISKKSVDSGREILKEVGPHLTTNARKVAEDLISMGDKLTSKGAQNIMRAKMLESIQTAVSTGQRPDYALKLMQNPIGYKQVKNALSRSPKGNKMWKALQSQAVEDIFQSTLDKNKQIDWNKAKDLLRDPHVNKIIKDAVGQEGLKFFKELTKYGKNIVQNLETFGAKTPATIRETVVNTMGFTLKSTLASMVGGKLGLLAYLGLKVVPKVSKAVYYKMLASPAVRKGFRKLMLAKNWKPETLAPTIEKINEGFGE